MEQRCHLSMVWLTWLGLPLLGTVVGVRLGAAAGVAVLLGFAIVGWVAFLIMCRAVWRVRGPNA